jgi:putative endonuclease
MFASLIFSLIKFRARNGLSQAPDHQLSADSIESASAKRRARETGIRGETYAYWYLRRSGYTMVARNYTFPGFKGEIDMVGYDGPIFAFVEVKTRSLKPPSMGQSGAVRLSPEDAVDSEKRRNLSRIAQQFLRARRIHSISHRFDILAIETHEGTSPTVRLTKGAFQMK